MGKMGEAVTTGAGAVAAGVGEGGVSACSVLEAEARGDAARLRTRASKVSRTESL
jgi:hypothetical protein